MKKNNLKRPIINKFIIGTLSAGLLAGGAAPETDAIFVREVYAADSTESSEGETLAEPSVPAEPTAVPLTRCGGAKNRDCKKESSGMACLFWLAPTSFLPLLHVSINT